MQEMAFPCFTFQNFVGEYTPRPPIHAWYIGHTRGLQPLLSPSNILSHRKVPFQKMPPPHGKILKKGPDCLYQCIGSANKNKLSLVGMQLPEKYKENFKFFGLNVEILRSKFFSQ
jgi:hypothetical protein